MLTSLYRMDHPYFYGKSKKMNRFVFSCRTQHLISHIRAFQHLISHIGAIQNKQSDYARLNLHMHTKCLNAETLVYKSLREENNVEYDQEIPQFHTTDKPAAS